MNKSELVEVAAKEAGITKAAADKALSAIIGAVVKTVTKGESVTLVGFGTFKSAKRAARKQWMADHLQLRGAVVVDSGAATKLRGEGKSLLPIGVVSVDGEFLRGDVIAVRAPDGAEIARGLANYSAAETRLIARKPSSQIEAVLGYAAGPELIHRDNLVLT